MNRQMTLAEMNDKFGAARTNKKDFLEEMNSIIPWVEIIKIVEPHYYKEEHGNITYPLELLLRFFILKKLQSVNKELSQIPLRQLP